ncbi:hypothetical protein FDECE_6374 [Fusarium decemcellulare]|nr:hypothetical protein FDECE_6374 [Fusarium decemcellulare]
MTQEIVGTLWDLIEPVVVVQQPPRPRPQVTHNFWPNLRDTLLNGPHRLKNLNLQCDICMEQMSVFDHEHVQHHVEKNMHHGARVLPCGHMFGTRCISRVIVECRNSHIPVSCPMCRTPFVDHPHCLHGHSGMPMPNTIQDIANFPRTLAEGGKIADKCGDCQVVDAVIGLSRLAPILYPPIDLGIMEVIGVSASKPGGHSWSLEPGQGMFNLIVEDLSLEEGTFQTICDETAEILGENTLRNWTSVDLRGLEFHVHIYERVFPGQGPHAMETEEE